MAIPDFLTYDGDASALINPFRPSEADLGGAAFVDDSEYPPDPNTQLTAAAENQNEKVLAAHARVTPVAIVYVKISAGVPAIFGIRSASSILLASDFTVIDTATGKTELKCSATKLIQPFVAIASPQATGDIRAVAYVNGTSDGIIVETRNSAGTLTDCDFAAFWY